MGLVVVKNGWESGDKDSFMPKFSADGLGFAAALWAKVSERMFHILPKGQRLFFRKNTPQGCFAVKKLGFWQIWKSYT